MKKYLLKRRKTLRFQIYVTIAITFLAIAAIYSLILYPFEKQRRETLIKKIELSINAIVDQREEVLANEMFLQHREAIEVILQKILEIEGMIAIGVFHPDGSVMTATENALLPKLTTVERETLAQTLYTFIEETWNDQHVVTYTKPIIAIGENLGYVKIYYTLADVEKETRLVFTIFTTLLLTIMVSMSVLLNIFLSRFIIRPMSTLMNAMKKVQEGHLGTQVDLPSESEIGKMAQTFNLMSSENARMYRELDELNKNLEQKVKERTAELTTTNEQLQQEIVERKRAEEALQHAKEAAEAASQAKSDFLSKMSHELRTPLNGIMGYAQIFRRDRTLSPEQQENVNIIYQSGKHLLTLIDDILDLSKIEAQKMDLYPADFHLPNFLKSIAEIISLRAQQKGIEFHYEAQTPLPLGVHADEKRLRQVLLNLLGNAVKFTDAGRVSLRVSVCSEARSLRSAVPHYKHIRFEVEDTGVGITPEHVKTIFLPFEQVGDTERRLRGTGLGLAISQQLVRMMGGQLQVKSTVGQGSTFWFDLELPEAVHSVSLKEVKTQNVTGFKGKMRKLLIVDDKPENTVLLENILAPLGFETIEAYTGQEALNKAMNQSPDLILMDLIMPGMDGFETIRRLRQIPALQDIPVIAVSANAFEQTRLKSLKVGSDGFLTKPLYEEDLLDALASHLHLEWIYDETKPHRNLETPPESQPLVLPEQEYLTALYGSVMIGDVSNLRKQLKEIETVDTKFLPFTQKLLRLANELKFDKIQNFLESYLKKE